MIKSEAYQILKCEHFDDVQDAYENALFEYKSKFLQQIPPLKLIKAIQKKIERTNTAYYVFYPDSQQQQTEKESAVVDGDLVLFLERYQLILSQFRLKITNSNDGQTLVNWIRKLVNHQVKLFVKLSSNLKADLIDLDIYPIKLSDEINVYQLQVELKALQIDQTKISEYIRAQINELDFEEFAYLTKVVINAEKQMIFNELRIRR